MSIRYSRRVERALSEVWQQLVDSGPGEARLEFYSGDMPESPDDPVTKQRLLARLAVKPYTLKVESGTATASGNAGWARLIASDGRAVADLKVGTGGDAPLVFNTVGLRKDGPITLFATRMAMFDQRRRS